MTDRFETIRQRMVQEQLVSRGIYDRQVLAVMGEVPRHLFVDDAMQANAYGDHPLPIVDGQTISQPFIVAYMTQALQLTGAEKVLEIGTGSGYQAVILSRLCAKLYTVERLNNLLASSRRVFDRLRCYNIQSKLDDGTLGWPEHAPYDAIMVTAGGPEIPEPLVAQLADPGRMVIPVGDQDVQELQLVTKKDGLVHVVLLERVRFVNLIGEYGWNK
ncbi:MAG: protein-L-isoaspartate(D-aspartate) O-methyltransferase [Desulfocapsaceae bacterium]|nr:protein-L-isoaspartate(D-aspartate) O-methyltransferase [Desulfocapsaceae bacterium]